MGTDNLKNLHLWKDWKNFFYNIPIAIFDRPSYSFNITKSKALFFFRKARIKNNFCKKIGFTFTTKVGFCKWYEKKSIFFRFKKSS